jgi:hypothetical protein
MERLRRAFDVTLARWYVSDVGGLISTMHRRNCCQCADWVSLFVASCPGCTDHRRHKHLLELYNIALLAVKILDSLHFSLLAVLPC